MNEIVYINEQLWPGIMGHFFVIAAFVSAIIGAAAYWLHESRSESRWLKLARWNFYVHAISVLAIVVLMLVILFGHRYEYRYAFDHLNNAMPLKYMLSCLWEGQEGSFILWIFWHATLSLWILKSGKEWESRVMAVILGVQAFLTSMLIGVYFGDFQFGADPFILLRDVVTNANLPWTKNPNYLSLPLFQDGKGLNPLLQNYWMTIHPPTLFLGFASTLIPFAYAIAGLWKRDLKGWMKPAIPWAFFGVMILGTGILMGGAWAYEALGFGGFWAWDPVENASLVPWLVLVGGAHLLLIHRRKNVSVFTTLVLILSSFILVLYSTFLTRSGVLGDSSVHSFVDSGILAQLLVYLLFFIGLATALLMPKNPLRKAYIALSAVLALLAWGNLLTSPEISPEQADKLLPGEGSWIPVLSLIFIVLSFLYAWMAYRRYFREEEEEEKTWSREFWMFIGSLILILMSIHVTVVTSVNIGNIFLLPFESFFHWLHEATGWDMAKRLAEHQFSAPSDKERFHTYHRIQIPLAVVLFLIISVGQFLMYRSSVLTEVLKRLALTFVGALSITLLLYFTTSFSDESLPVLLLLFSTLFAVLANAHYGIKVMQGGIKTMGASVAHVGFAMLILGALVSTSRSFFISENQVGNVAELGKEFNNLEDMMLVQGDTLAMGDYFVVYKKKEKNGDHLNITVDFFHKEPLNYREGEYRSMQGMIFRCNKDHIAGDSFLRNWSEDSLWSTVPMPTPALVANTIMWQPGKIGAFAFQLTPSVLQSRKGNSREPSIDYNWDHDLYTYLKYVALEEPKVDEQGYLESMSGEIKAQETIRLTETVSFTLDSILAVDQLPAGFPEGLVAERAFVTLHDNVKSETVMIPVISKNGIGEPVPTPSETFQVRMSIVRKEGHLELIAQQHSSAKKDMIILSAEVFPGINLLWLGCIIMVIGSTMAIINRIKNH